MTKQERWTDGGVDDLDTRWEQLEADLTVYLSSMVAADESDHLILELAGPSGGAGCGPYAQFAAFDSGRMIRAEVSADSYLLPQYRLGDDGSDFFTSMGWHGNDASQANWYLECPVADADVIANHVAWVLQHHFGIAHPQLLTHQAWGPAAAGIDVLGLCATGDVPADEPQAPQTLAPGVLTASGGGSVRDHVAIECADRDALVGWVSRLLAEKNSVEPAVDDDGDFVLQHLGQLVWVRVRADQPAVEVLARVAHGVHSRRAAAVEIGLLNRDNTWVRWVLRDRAVWQTLVLPAQPFVPRHLDAMLDLFFQAMSETREDLALRVGARVG